MMVSPYIVFFFPFFHLVLISPPFAYLFVRRVWGASYFAAETRGIGSFKSQLLSIASVFCIV